MTDHHEPRDLGDAVHSLGDDLLPACYRDGDRGGYRATPVRSDVTCEACLELAVEAPEPTEIERRLAEIRDPDGPTFVSPLGDRRERPVPCQRCRREKTFALGGVCVPCLERAAGVERLVELEAELEALGAGGAIADAVGRAVEALGGACSGRTYPVNPDAPEEGSDVVHGGPCSAHPDAEGELCDHVGDERVERIAHGYLGDASAGTREILCSGCGSEVAG